MSRTKRLFSGTTTTEAHEYDVTGSPAVPYRPDDGRGRTFEPDTLTTVFINGRFEHAEIRGAMTHNPGVTVTRRYDKAREVPEWARQYLAEPDDDSA